MSEELDPVLARLFAESAALACTDEQGTPTPDIEAAVLARIARFQRRRRIVHAVVLMGWVLAAAALTPYAVRASVALTQSMTNAFAAFGGMLVSPQGFGASLAVATLWVLRRARLRRVGSSWPPGSRGSAPGR